MNDFAPTNERLERIASRMPGYPLEPARLVRMTYLLQKKLRDKSNAVLKKYDLVDTSNTVLAILYGSPGETSTASVLSESCSEKPANLTRICDDLETRGLIRRSPKPGDRRGVLITLSEDGRTLIEQVLPEVSAAVTAAYAQFTPDELRLLTDLSARVLEKLNDTE